LKYVDKNTLLTISGNGLTKFNFAVKNFDGRVEPNTWLKKEKTTGLIWLKLSQLN